jgi:hypothetical protein
MISTVRYNQGNYWVQAQPTSSGIVGRLFYAHSATTKSGTYRFLHTDGGYPDGSTTKILWMVNSPQASGPLQIDGTNLSTPGKTFHQTIAGEAEIPSIVVVPSPGWGHTIFPCSFPGFGTSALSDKAERSRQQYC